MHEVKADNKIYGRNLLLIISAVLIRWCVSLHSYSGEKKPPMYGDFEAQRHWMEITYNLPISDWYVNTTDNDLLYWGLDYPPLTAYHSYICGLVASIFYPESVELKQSRGYENTDHKLFMRYTVLFVDMLTFLPAIYLYFIRVTAAGLIKSDRFILDRRCVFSKWVYISLALFYPGIILIDYGHFQYNCVSLGLFVLSVTLLKKYEILSAITFCLAFNYKQMELYHAIPFFFYFVAKFLRTLRYRSFRTASVKLFPIAIAVLGTFSVVWYPFLSDLNLSIAVIKRIFPVNRGVFEDKVSNFWCILNIVYKFRSKHSNDAMLFCCLTLTSVSILPSVYNLFRKSSYDSFILTLINTSLSFYLFSFQVHEKSILLVAIPVILYLPANIFVSFWFLIISVFSMLPLLDKDKLCIPYVSLMIIYYLLFVSFMNSKNVLNKSKFNNSENLLLRSSHYLKVCLFYLSIFGCICLTIISKTIHPPSRYPDLWPLLISFYSFCHFFTFLLYFNNCHFSLIRGRT